MAHIQQSQFFSCIHKEYPSFFSGGRVAEVGSLNINGSIRDLFKSEEYVGYDVFDGYGVDKVEQGQLISSPTGYCDVVVSSECFEHNPFWVETFSNMLRITRPGGLIVLSCATTGRQEHGTTRSNINDSPLTNKIGWSYYKNLDANDFLNTFNMQGWFDGFHFMMCPQTFDLYFYGVRSAIDEAFDEQRFINSALTIENEIYCLNNSIRIGLFSKSLGYSPR